MTRNKWPIGRTYPAVAPPLPVPASLPLWLGQPHRQLESRSFMAGRTLKDGGVTFLDIASFLAH